MLMKCICGFVIPISGTITIQGKVLGKDMDIPDHIGATIESPAFLDGYTGVQNLLFLSRIKNQIHKDVIKKYIRQVGLDPDNKKVVGKYSMGMKQRLALAQALMENPDILILDEPMNGLDNQGVEEMRAVIRSLKSEKRLILVSSHNKDDIEVLCDSVFEMDHGRIENR